MLKYLIAFSIVVPSLCATAQTNVDPRAYYHHATSERQYTPWYYFKATGRLHRGNYRKSQHPWPVSFLSIGHTIASYQRYSVSSPYFHHGIDIRADAGSDVLSSTAGKVVNIENYVVGNPAYWEVAVQDAEGFIWQYHHIDRSSIPKAIFDAYKNGTPIKAGTKIGEVYFWSVKSFGEYFHHIHLNILGTGGVYVNPFNFLKPLPDKAAPRITKVAVWNQKGDQRGSRVVTAPYTLYAEVEDLILHKYFKVPPYLTTISVDGGPTRTVWRFDTLPGGASKTEFVHNFFIPRNTCGNYSCRRFAINLGFHKGRQIAFPQIPGKHYADVTVYDYRGNRSSKRFEWTVTQ